MNAVEAVEAVEEKKPISMPEAAGKTCITKQKLISYVSLRMEIENRLERLARLRTQAGIPAMRQGDGSQHSPGKGDRMERAIIRYMEYEQKISPLIESTRAEMKEIEDAVNAVKDPLEREILRLRYIDGDFCRLMPWKDVAYNLFGGDDERHVLAAYRLHGKALISISKIKL